MDHDDSNYAMKQTWTVEMAPVDQTLAWIDEWTHGPQWKAYKHWKDSLGLPNDLQSIETGCGHGKFSMLLGLSGANVTLFDYNPETVSAAQKTHNSIGLTPINIVGDLLNPAEDLKGRYDLVCSFGTYEHFSGIFRETAIRNSSSMHRPGGLLFFTVPNMRAYLYRIALGLRIKLGYTKDGFLEIPYTKQELVSISQNIGLEPLQVESISTLKNDFDYWIMQNAKSLRNKLIGKKHIPSNESNTAIDIEVCAEELIKPSNLPDTSYWDKNFSSVLLYVGRKK